MSKNSKALDRIMRKGGPIADAIRDEFGEKGKSTLHAHRHGAAPTLQWSIFYEAVAGLKGDDWLSGIDGKRTRRRIERAVAKITARMAAL